MDPASTPESTDPSPTPPPPTLPWRVIRAVAKKAEVDPKTVKRRVEGIVTRPNVGDRIDAALVEIHRRIEGIATRPSVGDRVDAALVDMAKDAALRESLRAAATTAEARIRARAEREPRKTAAT